MVGGRRVKLAASNETTTTSMVTSGVSSRSDNNVVVSTVQPTTQQVSSLPQLLSLSLSLYLSAYLSVYLRLPFSRASCILVFIRRRVSSTGRSRDVSRPRERERVTVYLATRYSSAKCRRARRIVRAIERPRSRQVEPRYVATLCAIVTGIRRRPEK